MLSRHNVIWQIIFFLVVEVKSTQNSKLLWNSAELKDENVGGSLMSHTWMDKCNFKKLQSR